MPQCLRCLHSHWGQSSVGYWLRTVLVATSWTVLHSQPKALFSEWDGGDLFSTASPQPPFGLLPNGRPRGRTRARETTKEEKKNRNMSELLRYQLLISNSIVLFHQSPSLFLSILFLFFSLCLSFSNERQTRAQLYVTLSVPRQQQGSLRPQWT